jgi:hypothetical protein
VANFVVYGKLLQFTQLIYLISVIRHRFWNFLKSSMTQPWLRNRFDSGASPSWSTRNPHSQEGLEGSAPQSLPGAYIPDPIVDDIPIVPGNEETFPPALPPDTTPPNPDKICRICLSGIEEGINW